MMTELEKTLESVKNELGISLHYYKENVKPTDGPVCDRQFEGIVDDGSYTFFRFLHRNVGYVGAIKGAGVTERAFATMLPAYIESFSEKESELSKTEYLKRILLGECSLNGVYKYMTKFSVKNAACFAIVIRLKERMDDALALVAQYGGNSLDTVVKMDEKHCVLVKYLSEEENDYRSTVDYAEFLVQSLNEELGITAEVGVGGTVRELKDVAFSYEQASAALRYADFFEAKGGVHSYREFTLIKMLESVPENKLAEYLAELTDEASEEIFEDEEMLSTAEEFLDSSLNVSETSRNLYMHRNTLLYRLDKIEKATGLNIRLFSDAVSFRVLTILHKLLGK